MKKEKPAKPEDQLYNLKEDTAEKNNDIADYPERSKKMVDLLIKIVADNRIRQ